MLSCSNCPVGGRGFDETICKYFFKDFEERYKLNVPANKKAVLKLMTEAEKLKKLMASNTNKIPLNIECFMDDKDVKGGMDRACFEELIAGDLAQIEATLNECLETSKLKLEDIYSVEIVGGSSRIPKIKSLIEKVYSKSPSTTLNADEAVSRGCALQCAILSPTFKVREFSVTDIQPFDINLTWQNENKEASAMTVFEKFHQVPFSNLLTFYRKDPFEVTAEYKGGSDAVPLSSPLIGKFNVD